MIWTVESADAVDLLVPVSYCSPSTFLLQCRAQRSICSGGFVTSPGKFSDKMEALKNLVPATHNGEIVRADQLFQETADYIVLLRTQVLVLKGLIDFYGSSSEKDKVAVL
ncbi:hypothetical protein DKX38_005959 [Salix brachista]|uniref:BHLH domain-containing protein n=1 Tax=Salix brachista TaxID=2182728 RepID=A0A5N5N1A3_9ROSI|nr:hypothetical protein DKX38_005959 [Salix brachista]